MPSGDRFGCSGVIFGGEAVGDCTHERTPERAIYRALKLQRCTSPSLSRLGVTASIGCEQVVRENSQSCGAIVGTDAEWAVGRISDTASWARL